MPLRALAPATRRLETGGERHIHVHFAALAASNALRIGRLAGVPVSITPHAHEIYAEPRGVAEKLARAAFVATVCQYNVVRLRKIASPEAAGRIHSIPLGIDPARIRRSAARGDGRVVIAVGRLVEQKGFRHLIEAAAALERDEPIERLTIVGGGPLHDELATLAAELGIADRVEMPGPLPAEEARGRIELADLFVMPSVVAADGNRDAVPVVVLEAMALELPVLASDEVGLSEVVGADRGRLVPPGDSAALAAAIAELLRLPSERRAELGAAGRRFIEAERDLGRQTERLLALVDAQSIGLR